jgi:hypothetical protein
MHYLYHLKKVGVETGTIKDVNWFVVNSELIPGKHFKHLVHGAKPTW